MNRIFHKTGKGLDLSRAFYEEYGREMIRKNFPEYEERIAVGLCGEGSECFGYDDEISQDHDYDAGFCMWLTKADYESIGFRLYRAYEKLPEIYGGVKKKPGMFFRKRRKGVFSTEEFFEGLIGRNGAPCGEEVMEWFKIPEYALSQAVNGEVFYDGLGEFSRIREELKRGYPCEVRLKKIAARAVLMAQSGQYNFLRCIKHGERGAGALALGEFVKHASAMVFLLNGEYMPYYKWRFRKMRELPLLSELSGELEGLLCGGLGTGCEMPEIFEAPARAEELSENSKKLEKSANSVNSENSKNSVNSENSGNPSPAGESFAQSAAHKFTIIEEICRRIADELRRQDMSDAEGNFLENHALSVTEHISDGRIRNMHLMEGVGE